jgi:hypothetical protein
MENNSRDHPSLAQRLRQRIGEIALVDAHEHLLTEEQWLANTSGFSDMAAYVGYSAYDMVSAGMPTKALDPALSQAETWEYMRPFWPHVRNMGPGILCRRALAMFAGVQDLNDEALPARRTRPSGSPRAGCTTTPGSFSSCKRDGQAAVVRPVRVIADRRTSR